jgi:hypothetical protein
MTKCEILNDFPGSQDGLVTTHFKAGETVDISDYLLGCVDKSNIKILSEESEKPEEKEIKIENKAIISEGKKGKKS